jgi:hypothetical protein
MKVISSEESAAIMAALAYDPDTGIFTYLSGGGNKKIGKVAGAVARNKRNSHLQIWVNYKRYSAHRVAWFFVYGEWPVGPLDHINQNGQDNRIANLRLATNSQNQANRRIKRDKKSGPYKGVFRIRDSRIFRAIIGHNKEVIDLGTFPSAEDAQEAYAKKAAELFGQYARIC